MQQFGLIGNPLTHSFSKSYFEEKFKEENINSCQYDLYPLSNIQAFEPLIKENVKLKGLNVTIPYKESVMPFLDEIDPVAQSIGAVNTIAFEQVNGQLYLKGYNTDVIGFRQSLKPFLAKEHHRALIFGTGGASKAVAFVLKQLDIPFYKVSRNPNNKLLTIAYDDLDAKAIESFPLLINTTPLGMYPKLDSMPPIDLSGIGPNHLVYDLVYNPEESKLLKEAKKKNALCVNGLSMLKLQADAAWEIWNDRSKY
ncbi:MAG: shikimate dehydrogenase [Vicingaceae bacterium]